jgi:hypothetical protein
MGDEDPRNLTTDDPDKHGFDPGLGGHSVSFSGVDYLTTELEQKVTVGTKGSHSGPSAWSRESMDRLGL